MRQISLIVHDVRSAHNVGSLLRSADGLGVDMVYFTGYTPYPAMKNDSRLPHIAAKQERQIQKTALGAEKTVPSEHIDDLHVLIAKLKQQGYRIVALEQTKKAISLNKFKPSTKIALIVGSEVSGIDNSIIDICDTHVQIPMLGKKESFNVSVAAALALYHLTHM